jgi:predicted house-cleaning noncanonical NTP pyrophosphatase (MazG superfamily)
VSGVVILGAAQATIDTIGQKAYGLLTLPKQWVPPFFIVRDGILADTSSQYQLRKLLEDASNRSGVASTRVIVRSNGVEEGLLQRGTLTSSVCPWDQIEQTLRILRAQALELTDSPTHWIVQSEVTIHAQGQLSNERRVRYEKRDWAIEVEASSGRPADQISIGVRRSRDSRDVSDAPLACDSVLRISLTLRWVAMWAGQDTRRFLFEWVWDGTTIYIVQMDVAIIKGGINPKDLLPSRVASSSVLSLRQFHEATEEHKECLRKLTNASLYESLGYMMPPFYVLDNHQDLSDILKTGTVSPNLRMDMEELTRRPLVLRTDGSDIPEEKREMLPRSEELRNADAAIAWLLGTFRSKIDELGLSANSIALIGHHFIPSVASAWAGAEPGRRWVRIEALWGIPESLYWHSHDTFEVDTEKADLSLPVSDDYGFPIRSRPRYKGIFIAPNPNGFWVHHQTKQPFDWSPTISSPKWLCEIAHTTRRICEQLKRPIEVMWFVDTHPDATKHKVLPWYHSIPDNLDAPVCAPRKKIKSSQERHIRTAQDWLELQEAAKAGARIERVTVEPHDPELVRNRTFAEELGALAHKHGIVVVLAGGTLSHAYHALLRTGASVECVDLFGATGDQAEYNKLVRDMIPAQIADRGEQYEIVKLVGEALILSLRRKLVEEALEALDANAGTDLVGELADILEVVSAIAKAIGVSDQQLEEERHRKLKKRGGFDCGYMLLNTTSPYSLTQSASQGPLVPLSGEPALREITDPLNVPQKAVYKRPDHRYLSDSTEELLVVETELNRLGRLVESINYELPSNVDAQQYTSSIELSRTGGELRAVIRLRSRRRKGELEMQASFDFDTT